MKTMNKIRLFGRKKLTKNCKSIKSVSQLVAPPNSETKQQIFTSKKMIFDETHLIAFVFGVALSVLMVKINTWHPSSDSTAKIAQVIIPKEIFASTEGKIPVITQEKSVVDQAKTAEVKLVPVPGLPVLPAPKYHKPVDSQSSLEKAGGVIIDDSSITNAKNKENEDSGGIHVILSSRLAKKETPKTKEPPKTIELTTKLHEVNEAKASKPEKVAEMPTLEAITINKIAETKK